MSSQEDLRVVILGAGYGTRLQRDLEAIQNKPNPFSHLNGLPKPLLPLNEKPLLNFWIDLLARENISNEKIYIVTNDNFHHKFNLWAQQHNFPLGNILSDKTLTNETRLGALSDLHLAAKHFGLEKHHLLVIAGDTLLLPSFSLNGFFSHFFEKYHHNREANGCSLICYYELSDPNEVSKRGIIELKEDGSQQVVKFLEKPKPYRPDTTSNGDCSNTTHRNLQFRLFICILEKFFQDWKSLFVDTLRAEIKEMLLACLFLICWGNNSRISKHQIFQKTEQQQTTTITMDLKSQRMYLVSRLKVDSMWED